MRVWIKLAMMAYALIGNQALALEEQENFLVEKIIGSEVWVKKNGGDSKESLSLGSVLHAKDIIVTGDSSHAVIGLLDGSMISIGPFTEYQILKVEGRDGFWQWSFHLFVGTVRSLVRSLSHGKEFTKYKVNSDAGTAGVRGTDFVIAHSKDKQRTDVYTLEGEVYLGPPHSEYSDAKTVLLKRNRTSSIGKDGTPKKNKAFLRDEFLNTLKSRGFPDLVLGPDRSKRTKSDMDGQGAVKKHAFKVNDEDQKAAPNNSEAETKEGVQEWDSALLKSAISGDAKATLTALEKGANVDVQDEHQATALLLAAKAGHTLVMKALIDAGAKANIQDNEGNTALIAATRWGDIEGIVLLRTTNADINLRTKKDGFTAEQYAEIRGDQVIKKYLDAWRTEVNAKNTKNTKKGKGKK